MNIKERVSKFLDYHADAFKRMGTWHDGYLRQKDFDAVKAELERLWRIEFQAQALASAKKSKKSRTFIMRFDPVTGSSYTADEGFPSGLECYLSKEVTFEWEEEAV